MDSQVHVFNVYAPQSNSAKSQLWDTLANCVSSLTGPIIMIGDFNEVRSPNERMNSRFNASASNMFNSFIHGLDLLEYHMCRKRFTYMSSDLTKLSKLDRMLVSMDFMAAWPNAVLSALDRGRPDHCPLILECSAMDFGPFPFRFFNSWLKNPQLPAIVSLAIQDSHSANFPSDKKLAIKLKNIKGAVKAWRASEIEKEQGSICIWEAEFANIESKAENGILNEDDISRHGTLKMNINLLNEKRGMDLRQKARSRWAVEGDENTQYFHGLFKAHASANRINGMSVNGVWNSSPVDIMQHAFQFFKSKFQENDIIRPTFISPSIGVLCDADKSFLVQHFSLVEIKAAVWECGSEKSPGYSMSEWRSDLTLVARSNQRRRLRRNRTVPHYLSFDFQIWRSSSSRLHHRCVSSVEPLVFVIVVSAKRLFTTVIYRV
ncbi:hypothetical protein QVD17_20114 [Tagetes erecta]|uniref:RNA-directed DNA polymerase, eukaryota n=1 Tax=Tagetes erecta TaxID=13708 RepID=A0AAD8KP14_TARER|nr:hypothetical protein QVD17_20114 [Tagetes erecta]